MANLHFHLDEFKARMQVLRSRMADAGLDGVVLFRQESMYYLTGYDTGGYTMFQAMYVRADGHTALLTRPIDRIQAEQTSIADEIRLWIDRDGANPALDLRSMLEDCGARGKRLGFEYHAYGLTGRRCKMVEAALSGFCELEDCSDILRLMRLTKSPAELNYILEAGRICDHMAEISRRLTRPGASVKSIWGSMVAAGMDRGGDPAASRWPAGAGEFALLGRYRSGENLIGENDQVVYEPGAAYRHYHACSMYNIVVGKPTQLQVDMNLACGNAIDACFSEMRPGKTLGDVFEKHSSVLSDAGFRDSIMSACGYVVGAMYPPTWMEFPMVWKDNPKVVEAGMAFFLHMIIFDRQSGLSMSIGETAIVRNDRIQKVTNVSREVIVA